MDNWSINNHVTRGTPVVPTGAGSEETSKSDDESIKDQAEVNELFKSSSTNRVVQIDVQNTNEKVVEESPITVDEHWGQKLETVKFRKYGSVTEAGEGTCNIDNENELSEKFESLNKEDISITPAEEDIKTQSLALVEDSNSAGKINATTITFTENEISDNETFHDQRNKVKEEVTELKKIQLSGFLSCSYNDEDSISKYDKIDVLDNAYTEVKILQEKGKSLNDQLNENVEKCGEELSGDEKRVVEYVNDNTKEITRANKEHAANKNHVLTKGLSNEINSDHNTQEKLHDNSSLESSHITIDTGEQELTFIGGTGCSIKKSTVAEKSENLGSSQIIQTEGVYDTELEVKETVEEKDRGCFKENFDESKDSVNESKYKSDHHLDSSDYDADSSDTEIEQIEHTKEVKEALLSCLKSKCEIFDRVDSDTTEQVIFEPAESFETHHIRASKICTGVEISVEKQCEVSAEGADDKHSLHTISMPETRDNIDGSISPSLMFASCRYRWEKIILTQSPNVVFVTLNRKEIEPVQLEWSESSRCFFSEEIKVPVGVYVGNLVVDGTFYPVEDVVVKHYTFEVDIYLKDDILEDEGQSSGVAKAEEFIKQKRQTNGQDQGPVDHSKNHSSDRALAFPYPSTRAKMEEEPVKQTPTEGSVNVTSKYEELVRSQMNQNKGAFTDNDFDSSIPSGSNFSDLEGRRTPVGEDGEKQYQDSDSARVKTIDMQQNLENDVNSQNISKLSPSIDDFFEQRNTHSNGSVKNGFDILDPDTPPAVIEDVLGNGHTRTPIYSTESPVYSKHSSVHSSARQTPTIMEGREQMRPASVGSIGSVQSANSLSKHVLDDLISDAIGQPTVEWTSSAAERDGSRTAYIPARPESVGSAHSNNSESRRPINDLIEDSLNVTRTPPPSRESSIQGSRAQTPPAQEQIDDVLNPADRHSPIRREFLAGSLSLLDHSAKSSRSSQSSAHSSQRHTPQRELISNSLRTSQEKLYSSHSSGSNVSSRPQSLTSEQELTQYYENLKDIKSGNDTDTVETTAPKTGSASSLPAIGSQQRYTPEKRSMTPDNHIRVPVVGSVTKTCLLLQSRTPPRTPLSNASSRTVTPVNTETDTQLKLKEQVKDLENTGSNLRQLLTSREHEILELKDQFSEVREINEKLQGDLDRHRGRTSQGTQIAELERKVQEADKERDDLIAEISLLKEELQKQKEPGLNSYNPKSPAALQRKIDELNSQIQDLHEVHEVASEEIQAAERKVKELAAENENLRVTQSKSLLDVEDENRRLLSEVQRIRESNVRHTDASDYRLKIELQQVKEDNHNLRERNYMLHDDNIRLKEELSDVRKTIEFMDRKVQQKKERVSLYDAYDSSGTDRALKSSYHSYSRLSEPNKQMDRELESYTKSRSSYDMERSESIRDVYKEEGLTKLGCMRYESFRMGPDGGSSDKLRSSLGPPKREYSFAAKTQEKIEPASKTVDHGDHEHIRCRGERSRTSSAEIDFRSAPLAAFHGDLSKTIPALTGRSRAIYKEISDLRSQPKAHLEDADRETNICESADTESTPETEVTNTKNMQALSSQVFVNRFVPQNQVAEVEETNTVSEMLTEKQSLLSSLPIVTKSGYCDDGNTSDTPTDILVSIKPVDKIRASSWSKGRQRRGSVGSDASESSLSDIDDQITASVRKRSKSADGREVLRRIGPTGSSSKENLTLSRTLSPAPSAGLRTVTPRPIATQHNKSTLSLCSSFSSLTKGLQPFAPRSAQDLQIKDVIKFSRQGGKLSQGTIKFIGHLPGRGDIYLGVELDKEDGKHDGVFEGIRYFKCKPSKGVFVAYNKVVMAWTAY